MSKMRRMCLRELRNSNTKDNKYADLDDEVTEKKLRQVWNDLTLGSASNCEISWLRSGLWFVRASGCGAFCKRSRFIARCLRGRSRFRRGSLASYPGEPPIACFQVLNRSKESGESVLAACL